MAQNITPESLISILAAALAQKPTKPLVLPQRQDHPCRPAGPAVPGQHRPAHGRFLSAARPACTRLGKNALRQHGPYPSAGRSPAPGL